MHVTPETFEMCLATWLFPVEQQAGSWMVLELNQLWTSTNACPLELKRVMRGFMFNKRHCTALRPLFSDHLWQSTLSVIRSREWQNGVSFIDLWWRSCPHEKGWRNKGIRMVTKKKSDEVSPQEYKFSSDRFAVQITAIKERKPDNLCTVVEINSACVLLGKTGSHFCSKMF